MGPTLTLTLLTRGPPRIKRVIECAHRPLKSYNMINHSICLAVNRLLGKLTLIKGFSRAKGEMGELLPFDDECVSLCIILLPALEYNSAQPAG